MMKRIVYLIILPTLVAILFSCTERIDLPLDEGDIKLVVEGYITTDTTVHSVFLTQTTGYYDNQASPPVSGAYVTYNDGEKTIELKERLSGIYQTTDDFHGVEGKTYTLNIRLAAPINGFSEYSASAYMDSIVTLDSAGVSFRPDYGEQGMWEVKCWIMEPPTTDFYKFELKRNNSFITSNISKWIVTDDRFFNGQYIRGGTISYLSQVDDEERLMPGDTIDMELHRISREYYNFITDASTEMRGSNPLFSGPGANIRGNISNDAIGFFAIYPISRVKFLVP